MRAIKFNLRGETAFFKKPDVNTFLYFTYGNIHKVALIGMLGAIMGFKGYNSQTEKEIYPEFYAKLKDLEVSIVPKRKSEKDLPGVLGKKVQTFNNSVGYASAEAGGNLIVKEQWLEKPSWDIYIKEGHPCYEMLLNRLQSRQYVYMPYLGKNDHLATITAFEEVDLNELAGEQKMMSLCLREDFEMVADEDDEEDFFEEKEIYYKYEEKLPIALEPEQNQYEVATFILTNQKLKPKKANKVYQTEHQENIYFI